MILGLKLLTNLGTVKRRGNFKMNEYLFAGFNDEMEKVALSRKTILTAMLNRTKKHGPKYKSVADDLTSSLKGLTRRGKKAQSFSRRKASIGKIDAHSQLFPSKASVRRHMRLDVKRGNKEIRPHFKRFLQGETV